jgi:hypothetical protein
VTTGGCLDRSCHTAFAALVLALALSAGCGKLEYEGWLNQPLPITVAQDIPLVQVRYGASSEATAVVDTGTPLVVLDRSASSSHSTLEIRLQDGAFPAVTRFIFHNLDVWDLRVSSVGVNTAIPIGGILGATLLQSFAVHLSYGATPALTFKDEIPDSNQRIAMDCDPQQIIAPTPGRTSRCLAVLAAVPLGEGVLSVGSEVVDLPPTRLALPLCLLPNLFDPTKPRDGGAETPSGVDVTAVVATGLGTSVLARSSLERLRAAGATIVEQPGAMLYLPSGQESVSIVQVDRVAVVSDETILLGPCGELARRRRLLVAGSAGLRDDDRDQNGASVALVSEPVQMAVLDDDRPLLQGLRKELGPVVAETGMVIGGSLLKHFEADLDYPKQRVILQCATNADGTPATSCQVYPWCGSGDDPRCPSPPK